MIARRRQILNFFTTFAVIALSLSSAAAQGSDGVSIYNGRDGSGQSQAIPAGVYQVSGKALGTDVSVKVAKEYFVRFCSGKDGTGNCEEFGEGTHNLASVDFNFIKVWKGLPASPQASGATPVASAPARAAAVVVFEQKNWLGRSQNFGPGMYRSYRAEFGKINDNQARSIVLAKGYKVRLCSEEGMYYRGSGDCEVYEEEGKYNLRFANSISFIEVTIAGEPADDEKKPVVLYEDAQQAGKMQGFDVGTFDASKGEFKKLPNDEAASIVVKDGYRASVCADAPASEGGEGVNCEEFGPGRKNLKTRDVASYLRVWKESK